MIRKHQQLNHIQVNVTLLLGSLAKTLVVMTCQKVGVSMKKATSSWTTRTTTTTGRFVLDASSDTIYNPDIDLMTSPRPRTALLR
jgi:hypothetical protein